MDEIQVYALIADGESTNVEFKRELDLNAASSKAEFIKDVIALVNSTADAGYMLIGVDNNKMIVGVNDAKEEQIQQILSTYIAPPVNAIYESIPMHSVGFLQVGVLTVKPTQKPHSVARSIGNRTKNEAFVRHGTVVEDASPDEIILMRDSSRARIDSTQYVRAAKTHEELGYRDMAINAYSKAIELTPTAELFLARGNVYERYSHEVAKGDKRDEIRRNAFRDYSDAVKLATTSEIKKTARLRRWYLNPYLVEDYNLEREWLISNTSGRELGKVLFVELEAITEIDGPYEWNEPVATLNEIIELGYREPEVYERRALAHCLECNYGLALKDIDKAISSARDTRTHAEWLMFRASILIRMEDGPPNINQHFIDAYDDIAKAYEINGPTDGETIYYFEDEIFYKAILGQVLRQLHGFDDPWWSAKLRQQLIQDMVRAKPSFVHEPKFANTLIQLLGESLWLQYISKLKPS